MNEDQAALIGEQFAHAVDLLKAEQRRQAENIAAAQQILVDHETRLRFLTDTSTQFRFLVSLSAGGGLLGLIGLLVNLFR